MITHELVKIKMDGAAHHSSYKSLVKRVLILLSQKGIENNNIKLCRMKHLCLFLFFFLSVYLSLVMMMIHTCTRET